MSNQTIKNKEAINTYSPYQMINMIYYIIIYYEIYFRKHKGVF